MKEPVGRAKGGIARAGKLSAERKTEIARKAAHSRWNTPLPKADYLGKLPIGEMEVDCAVLPDGTRVLSQRGVGRALGRIQGGQSGNAQLDGGEILPFYLNVPALKPFISNELMVVLQGPVLYRHGKGGGVARGLPATALPQVCNVWLAAREAHNRGDIRLNSAQLVVAMRAEIIMRGLAEIGIVALVDEVTGYQEARERDALQEILNAFLRKELAAWAKRFPDEFYQHIYRLRGWDRTGKGSSRPQIVAYYTKDIVYARLAPGIIEELERRNPSERGRRKSRHHQWLTDDVGHPALAQHLYAAITLMRVSKTWDQFKALLDAAHPVRGDTLQLPLMLEPNKDSATPIVSASEPLPLLELLHAADRE